MAQLKDLIVNGATRLIGDAFANTIQITTIKAPSTAGGTTYTAGTNGYVLKSNGSSVYWGSDSNNTYTFANGTTGNFTVTPSGGSAQTVSIGKPATAGTADKLGSTTVGSNVKAIYLNNGTATASDHEFAGGYAVSSPNINTLYDSGFYSGPGGSATNYPANGTTYATIITAAYRKPSGNTKTDYAFQIGDFTGNKSTLWFRTSNASAWSAWQNFVHITANTAVGGPSTPVYVDADGKVTALNYTIETSVPSNAVFTDTTYTFGNGTNCFYVKSSASSTTQTVTVTPSITNNITGSGTSNYLVKFNGTNTITNGPQLGSDATKFLNNKGEWVTVSTQLDYGDTLPATGNTGDVFLQLSNPYYELPIGGVAGQALVKATNDDRVVTWRTILPDGGSTGQVLTKTSNSNYSIGWMTPPGGYNPTTSIKYYVAGSATSSANLSAGYFDTSIYVENSVLFGAAWNDYAEYRITKEEFMPGRCVIENGDDTLILSSKRLQPGANIISDTYGFVIGQTDDAKTPIAVSGRVLAYPYEDVEEFKNNIGHPVCSGPNGTVSIMTDEEYKNYGYCAIGTISAIPNYDEWGKNKIKVNNRVWIKVG